MRGRGVEGRVRMESSTTDPKNERGEGREGIGRDGESQDGI
jgi:hypothetical protein